MVGSKRTWCGVCQSGEERALEHEEVRQTMVERMHGLRAQTPRMLRLRSASSKACTRARMCKSSNGSPYSTRIAASPACGFVQVK